MVALLTLAAYFIGFEMENGYWGIGQSNDGITMAFLTLSMAEMFMLSICAVAAAPFLR